MVQLTLQIVKDRLPILYEPCPLLLQIYAAPLKGGARAVVLFNRHQQLDPMFNVQNLTVFWGSIGLAPNATVSPLARLDP